MGERVHLGQPDPVPCERVRHGLELKGGHGRKGTPANAKDEPRLPRRAARLAQEDERQDRDLVDPPVRPAMRDDDPRAHGPVNAGPARSEEDQVLARLAQTRKKTVLDESRLVAQQILRDRRPTDAPPERGQQSRQTDHPRPPARSGPSRSATGAAAVCSRPGLAPTKGSSFRRSNLPSESAI